MNDADPHLMTLFSAALDRGPGADRAAYLDQACGADPDLRGRVEALLRAHEGAGRFLEPSPAGSPAPGPAAGPAETTALQGPAGGTVLAGRYKLLEPVGEGGMGEVWMAQQQEPVKRLVAVKLIKPGMDSRQVLTRFEAERQALALMDHPNIAKVHDAGVTPDGRPFFVMELVKGVPITKYCDDHRLTPRQRLELFVPVCQAIQHAHQKGVIHRDVKPSNVLVALYDDRPVPKVIDFGVAKATGQALTEQTLHTGFGAVVGTIEYMSPEQATFNQLDVDTRSDVYSLGVLLYELLAGSPPFSKRDLEKAGVVEMLRVIREQEPSKPSTKLSTAEGLPTLAANRGTEPARLTRLVRGELDWIVMKALEKDRSRRYETANGFAADVLRYLADEAVQACPPSATYRLKKFVRRNKGPALAGTLVLLVLLGGTIGTTVGMLHAREARQAEADRAEGERQAKQRAEANFVLANEAVEKYLGTVTNNRKLTQADFHELRKALLESAIPFFQKLSAQKSDDPDVEARRGRAYGRLGHVREAMGENGTALQDHEAARAIFARLAADFPAVPAYRQELANSLIRLGGLLHRIGKSREAEPVYRQAKGIWEKLADDVPAEPEYRAGLATSHNDLGILLAELGQHEEAELLFGQGIVIRKKLADDFPTVRRYRKDLAGSHTNLSNLLSSQVGRTGEAESSCRQALDIAAKLAAESTAEPTDHEDLASSHFNLGVTLTGLGKREEAKEEYDRAIAIEKKLAADFPTVPAYRNKLAKSYCSLGGALDSLGKYEDAVTAIGQAIAIQKKLADDFPTTPEYRYLLAYSHVTLGTVLWRLDKLEAAVASLRESQNICEKLVAGFPNMPEYRQGLAMTTANLAVFLTNQRKRAEAAEAYRSALDNYEQLARKVPTLWHIMTLGHVCSNYGDFLMDEGEAQTAIHWFEKAIARLEPIVAKEPQLVGARKSLGDSHRGRARALDALDRRADAMRDWERALALDPDRLKPIDRLRIARNRKDAAGCLAAAAENEAWKPTAALEMYDAACNRAICAVALQEDAKTPKADAPRLAKEQADLAMAWLRKAVAAGYRNAERVKHDKDLDALREREEFKKLLAELDANKK